MISKQLVATHLILLALLVGCTFFNAVHSSFKMDDHDFFKDPKITNPKYFNYNWLPEPNRYLKLSVASEESSYRPVTNSALSILYHQFGTHVESYHRANIFLFFLGCSLLYVFVLLLSGSGILAFLTASLFIVHPINGLAVNYVVASAYAYQLIFNMLCLISFVLAFKLKNQWLPLFLSGVFFLISLGVHETSIILPVYLLGIAWLLGKGNLRVWFLKTLPFFFMLFSFLVFRMEHASLKTGVLQKFADFQMSLGQFLATFFKLIAWYLSQLIVPDGVVLMWSSKVITYQLWGWITAGVLFLGLAVLIIKKCGRSVQSWACASFVVGFLPIMAACLFRPTTGLVMEPHWMFLPSIGFFILYASLLNRILEWKKWIGIFLTASLLAGFVSLSHIYNDLWKDEQTYCHYWLKKVPSFKTTEFFLAYAYMQEKKYDQARYFLLNAREGIFSDWQIYGNLGLMDYEQGKLEEALENYKTALKINPASGEIYNNLAVALEKIGKQKEAVAANEQALRLNQFMVEPRLNLARVALANKDVDTALRLYKENLLIFPYDKRTLHLLFTALMDAGNNQEAEGLIRDVIANSKNEILLTDMAVLATEKRQLLWAIDLYMQALRINPNYKETYVQAGVLLANLNFIDRAIQMWERALSLGPDDKEVLELIKKAKANREQHKAAKNI